MDNPLSISLVIFKSLTAPFRSQQPFSPRQAARNLMIGATAILGLFVSGEAIAQMEDPETAPAEITALLTEIDVAANQQSIDTVMQFYSTDFRNSDGLNYTTLQQSLSALWERYPTLTYQTELIGWEETDEGILTETVTTIVGSPEMANREFSFTATITSQQQIEAGKIIEQTILDESSSLTTGDNPPDVEVNLPDEVLVGRDFSFDAIVTEPLGDRRLLGVALDEPVSAANYLNSTSFDLEVLSAGGLFKVGEAPIAPGSRWISGVLVREDGITIVTQRLRAVNLRDRSQ